jgi:uncharacterized protein with PIN domain
MRFLCDEMLAGLGRWLRAAGYDTTLADPGMNDRDLVEWARAEDRLLLTRDRRLIEIRGATDHAVVLLGNGIDACAAELSARLGLDWRHRPFSRCLVCNALLENAGEHLRSRLPERARALPGPLTVCPACGRLYWPGSHVRRMRRRLASFG